MCPEGITPCKTFGGPAFGAAWMGTTEELWTGSEALAATAGAGGICRHGDRKLFNSLIK